MNLLTLAEPFEPKDIEWRIAQAGKKGDKIWAKVLAYITSRAIMNRLDEVCGPENWRNEYATGPQGGVLCGISVQTSPGVWVTKWDGADNTDIEAIKGGLSDAMKRAGVQWGIGRYLYNLDEGWAVVGDKGEHFANCKIKVSGKEEYASFHWSPPQLPAWALPKAKPTAPPKAPPKKAPEKSATPPAKPAFIPEYEPVSKFFHDAGCKSADDATLVAKFCCASANLGKAQKDAAHAKEIMQGIELALVEYKTAAAILTAAKNIPPV
jgi:hypothetical protein